MRITKALKNWLVENCGIKSTASDDEFRRAAAAALLDGSLSAEKHLELVKEPEDEEATEFTKRFDQIANGLEKVVTLLTPKEEKKVEEPPKEEKKEVKTEKPAPSRLAKMIAKIGGFSEDDEQPVEVRVKSATESYSTTKSALTYPERTRKGGHHLLAGQRVMNQSRAMDTPSDLDKALSGVWAKFQIMSATPRIAGSAQRAWELMTDHEKSLMCHLADNCEWDDSRDNRPGRSKGYPGGIKAIIDDAVSGGLEAAPIVFDDQVIQAPLLYGELYPLVNEVPLDRGRRIEGVATGTVTGAWGGVDDTAVSLFATAAYVAAFDTTVFRWEGAITIGLDFLSDTPIDFNAHVTAQYGERLLEDLDDVIATGNGTTQPEGVINHAGVTAVAWGGATSLANYESLRFAVHKREHQANVKATAVFCGTDTSYSRAMAIPVGAADARRVFGASNYFGTTSYDDYQIMGRPYKINESLTNSQIFYAILGRYRMYRRKGLTVRTSMEGDTLIRNNEVLIVVMARYGGQLERAACAALTTTAPA